MANISKDKVLDYVVLVIRILLAWTFLDYGLGKMTGEQFGLSEAELSTPIKDLSLFKISWYLFDHQPFKYFIGISQIVCSMLLLFNRTALIGALFFLPIATTILVIDLTFMPHTFKIAFGFRLSSYLLLDALLLWHYKGRFMASWKNLTDGLSTKFNYPIWAYLVLPILAIMLDLILTIPKILFELILDPENTIKAFQSIPDLIKQLFN